MEQLLGYDMSEVFGDEKNIFILNKNGKGCIGYHMIYKKIKCCWFIKKYKIYSMDM